MRQFLNPNNIAEMAALSRLRTLDTQAEVDRQIVCITPPPNQQFAEAFEIDSALTDEQINTLLSTPQTQAEIDEITQSIVNTETIRSAYITIINRLEQIQSAVNPTNAQIVQAVKDMAEIQEQTLRFLKRLFN